ncbi:MAG: helix-turn-helix transcriptional regulator, partial [Planctomycetes bacterium]|nr:helix-turn-helix transcriptional regulator [Planctomycetota bacterium]
MKRRIGAWHVLVKLFTWRCCVARPQKSSYTGIDVRLTAAMVATYRRAGSGTKLAKAVGVSTAQVSRWESGVNLPTYGMLIKIATVLGLEPGWLAFGRGPEHPPPTEPDAATTAAIEEA